MTLRKSAPAALLALLALLAVAFSAGAGAGTAPARDIARQDVGQMQAHNLPGPMTKEFEARREAAVEAKLRGEAPGKVVRLGKNKYVELGREKTDPVFVVIAEFGNARHASFCDAGRHRPGAGRSRVRSRPTGRRRRSTGRSTTRSRSRTARSTTRRCGSPTTTSATTRTCTSTAWRSTSSTSRRTATRSWRPATRCTAG